MLANELISTSFPTAKPDDKIHVALQLMDDFDIVHIPVVDHEKFIGLLSKDDLLDANEDAPVKAAMEDLMIKSVKGTEYFLSAVRLASQNNLSMVPVVNNENDWLGAISIAELLKAIVKFSGTEEPGALIILEMERKSYSFGEISRLVETNDAHITQLNTYTEIETGLLIVTIKLNKLEVSDILSTFQRYDYSVRYFIGEQHYENELKYNYDHLMTYLKV